MNQVYNIPPQYLEYPVSHQVLKSLLKNYKRPNDKIYEMVKSGELIPLRKGLYQFRNLSGGFPEPFTIANVLYGPSYVSAESALTFHGLIPEQVFTAISMTTKKSATFQNEFGRFDYKHLPASYYALGIQRTELREKQFALIAVPEKALFDKVVITPGILFRSISAAKEFLLENMRMDEERLLEMNPQTMESWLEVTPKKESLQHIIKAIQSL